MVMGPSMVERMGMAVESQMMMPCTPLCELMRFSVSSTSDMLRRQRRLLHKGERERPAGKEKEKED